MADIARAAALVRDADALLVAAGAGMGVDSGLPDFRGTEGFWGAYPMFAKLGLRFEELANPEWFTLDPTLAWGFYGHRLGLYRATAPHDGYAILQRWGGGKRHGLFVFTSNVDSHFQRAGVAEDRIVECHGTLSFLQCHRRCGEPIFPSDGVALDVDPQTCRANEPLPACPGCGGLARPNVLMFGDWEWDSARTDAQTERISRWLSRVRGSAAVVELGAGSSVPTVRRFSEAVTRGAGASLVRVNPREAELDGARGVGLASGALETLRAMDAELR